MPNVLSSNIKEHFWFILKLPSSNVKSLSADVVNEFATLISSVSCGDETRLIKGMIIVMCSVNDLTFFASISCSS